MILDIMKVKITDPVQIKQFVKTLYIVINSFAVLSFLFDFVVTYTVVKYDYLFFVSNEQNSAFISFIHGNHFSMIYIILLNLLLYLPFFIYGYYYIKQDDMYRKKNINFIVFIMCMLISYGISMGHINGGLSWII